MHCTFQSLNAALLPKREPVEQGCSKSAFKGPNLNFYQCHRSRPEQLVITKLAFNKHTVAYITCITNKDKFFEKNKEQEEIRKTIEVDRQGFFSGRCRYLQMRASDGRY